jgi:hypothetical protein
MCANGPTQEHTKSNLDSNIKSE